MFSICSSTHPGFLQNILQTLKRFFSHKLNFAAIHQIDVIKCNSIFRVRSMKQQRRCLHIGIGLEIKTFSNMNWFRVTFSFWFKKQQRIKFNISFSLNSNLRFYNLIPRYEKIVAKRKPKHLWLAWLENNRWLKMQNYSLFLFWNNKNILF